MAELTGSLTSIDVAPLIRFLSSLGKSGDLLISRGHWIGQLSLDHGRLMAAAVGDEEGPTALEFICAALRGGDFEFSEGPPSLGANLDLGPDTLSHIERLTSAKPQPWIGEVPSPTEVPRVVKPTSPPDDAMLSLERSSVFLLLEVDGRRTVREIARQYGLLRALRALSRLREAGLIAVDAGSGPPGAGAGPSRPIAGTPNQAIPLEPAPEAARPAETPPASAPATSESWRDRLGRRGASLLQSEVLQAVVVTGVLVIGIRTVVENFRVEGVSMQPTFDGGQVLVVNRAAYFHMDDGPLARLLPTTKQGSAEYVFGGPQRGDIAVFRAPPQPDADYIKRIIGLPGDQVLVRDGQVFINGERLDEPYIRFPASYTFPGDGRPLVVPDRNYFVLGDNRPESFDSHLGWVVPADDLIGRAWIRYWPPDALAVLPAGERVLAQVAAQPAGTRP